MCLVAIHTFEMCVGIAKGQKLSKDVASTGV